MVRLSILICTMPSRKAMFDSLLGSLTAQTNEQVEILYDASEYKVGAKRQRLLLAAKGDYVVYIDDDDTVSDQYIPLILQAIESNPDCIGIRGTMTTNGRPSNDWEISIKHKHWVTKGSMYLRHTSHLSPVRREIALKVGFPDIAYSEDYKYSMGLVKLVKTEVMIEEPIYHYKYISKK